MREGRGLLCPVFERECVACLPYGFLRISSRIYAVLGGSCAESDMKLRCATGGCGLLHRAGFA